MAKKKSKSSGGAAPDSSSTDDATSSSPTATETTGAAPTTSGGGDETLQQQGDEVELLQVDLGDMIKMKQVLDEAVAGSILQQLQEDYHWDNWKLGLMTLACVFAMMAQFAPVPFPDSRPILGACGSAYFLLSGILQFITTFVDKDAILLTQPAKPADNGKVLNKDLTLYGVRVRSSFPRFSEYYTVILEFRLPSSSSTSPQQHFVQQTWSVGQFFDKEGYFDETGLMQEVEKLYKRFEAKNYDDDNEKATASTKKTQ